MKEITYPIHGIAARKKILKGVNAVYDVVKLTLGPEGRNAILPRTFNRGPRHTNDGVTISENVMLPDEHERLAADAFKEGAKKTNELAGDGTTSTTVIGGHLINKVFTQMLEKDVPVASINGKKAKTGLKGVRALRQEIKEAKDLVIQEIKTLSKPIKTLADLEKIALVSIGKEDEIIAKTVAKMVFEIGRDGAGNFIDNHIDIVEGFKGQLETEVIKGMRFPAKADRNFVTHKDRFEMVAEDVPVLITNYKIDNAHTIIGLIEVLKTGKIAILAPDFSLSVLKSFILSVPQGVFIYPVKCPSLRTEQLEDIAVYTGATVIDKEKGRKIENTTMADLGFAAKIIVKDTENREDAVLLGGKGENQKRGEGNMITERCNILKKQIKESRNELTTISLQKRIANLSSAVGIIRVGSTTSAEGLYLKLKIEDGVYSCKAALEEGYVEGGGICLKKIAEKLPENILTESLKAPYEQIQKNAGGSLEIGKEIIDSAKVVRLEVEHGVSVASMMITTDILIPEAREKTPAEGYEAIAKAVNRFSFYWAKQQGLIKENEDEAEEDRNREFEKVIAADKG